MVTSATTCVTIFLFMSRTFKHGLSGKNCHPLYRTWKNIKRRCYNEKSKDYRWYGAKGVTMCDEWRTDFIVFYNWAISNGWGKDLQIDRIDFNGHYAPENCRWLTDLEQAQNTSQVKLVTYLGKIQSHSGWARELGLDRRKLSWRLANGWTVDEVFTIP